MCRYGYNGVCASLPLDGVSDGDYEQHVRRHHVLRPAAPAVAWSVYSASQNLPAVLNDPGRPKKTTFFTETWGDSFVERADIRSSPHLPEITHAHLDHYMRKLGKKYRKHSRIVSQCKADGEAQRLGRTLSAEYDLSEIPALFFEPNLPLKDATTFDTVFEGLGDWSHDSRTPCRALQERLSHLLDIVEVQIARQVSQKSDAFFHAMLSHDTIMEQMSSAISVVKSLRGNIGSAKSGLADSPLKLVKLATFKNNSSRVHEKLKLMSTVHQTQPMIQLLLSTADYVTALDLIGTTQSILSRELSGVHAFRHLSSQLSEMERLIDKMLTTEFRRFVTADLNRPTEEESRPLDEDKFMSVISGLLRRKRLEFLDIYKEEAITTIQATVKQVMIEEASGQEGEVWVRGQGESGGWRGGAGLLGGTTRRLLPLLHRVLALRSLVVRASLAPDVALADGEDFFSEEDQKNIETKLGDLVNSICDYCLEKCAGLLNNGEKESSSDGEKFAELSTNVEDFTAECEEISGRPCSILRNAFKNRIIRYIQRFHNERRNKLTLLLDNERWKKAEVPAEFQAMADHICQVGAFGKTESRDGDSEKPPASFLILDKEPYSVVGVALMAMRMVGEYCRAGEDTGAGAPVAGSALAELLRLFNSRSCQLVLGAGALQSAGLKTITATNLGLASRALQLLLRLLIPVRHHFPTLSAAYLALERDLRSHVAEIETKLAALAGGLLGAQLASWEARPPVPSQPFRHISRQLLKLHEALAGVLPPTQLQGVYVTVHHNFKEKLRENLVRLNIVGNGGPQHGVVTSELTFYLQTMLTLRVLPEEELTLHFMDEIWLK